MDSPAPTSKTSTEGAGVAIETAKSPTDKDSSHGSAKGSAHGAPEVVEVTGDHGGVGGEGQEVWRVEQLAARDKRWYAYFLTRDFYIVLALG